MAQHAHHSAEHHDHATMSKQSRLAKPKGIAALSDCECGCTCAVTGCAGGAVSAIGTAYPSVLYLVAPDFRRGQIRADTLPPFVRGLIRPPSPL